MGTVARAGQRWCGGRGESGPAPPSPQRFLHKVIHLFHIFHLIRMKDQTWAMGRPPSGLPRGQSWTPRLAPGNWLLKKQEQAWGPRSPQCPQVGPEIQVISSLYLARSCRFINLNNYSHHHLHAHYSSVPLPVTRPLELNETLQIGTFR